MDFLRMNLCPFLSSKQNSPEIKTLERHMKEMQLIRGSFLKK